MAHRNAILQLLDLFLNLKNLLLELRLLPLLIILFSQGIQLLPIEVDKFTKSYMLGLEAFLYISVLDDLTRTKASGSGPTRLVDHRLQVCIDYR